MAKDLQIRKAVIPDDYKLILNNTTILCDSTDLPTLPTFTENVNDRLMVAGSTTKPGQTYVCDKYIIYNYSPTTTISVNTSTYEINIPMSIISSTTWTNNFRFIRFDICISGLSIINMNLNDIVDIYFNISLTFGQVAAVSKTTLVETIKQGSSLNFGVYYYDFIYDTRLNTLYFDKKSI